MPSIGSPSNETGRGTLAVLGKVAAALLMIFLLLDIGLRIFVPRSGLLARTIDIQTPAALYAKLEAVRRTDRAKVILLGDSLVFGRTMREHGNAAWQSHTLDRQLEAALSGQVPDPGVMVANLGMNGALPSDLEQLVRIIEPLQPDLLIFDLTLRSFSRDFSGDSDVQTRKWLAEMQVSPSGRLTTARGEAGLGRAVRDASVNHWHLYRLKDTIQAALFDGEPVAYLRELRNRTDAWIRGDGFVPAPPDTLELLMKAKGRYEKIDLAADNPQVMALQRLLERVRAAKIPTIVFYATESPEQTAGLMPSAKWARLHRDLAAVVDGRDGGLVQYIGPQAIYEPQNFLDHVHLDKDGYRKLAQHLAARVAPILAGRGRR